MTDVIDISHRHRAAFFESLDEIREKHGKDSQEERWLRRSHAKDIALENCTEGLLDWKTLATACVLFMTDDQVADMLRANEIPVEFPEEFTGEDEPSA